MDIARLSLVTGVQQRREIVAAQLIVIAQRDEGLAQHDASLARAGARLAERETCFAQRDQTIIYKEVKLAKLTAEIMRLRQVQFAERSKRMGSQQRAVARWDPGFVPRTRSGGVLRCAGRIIGDWERLPHRWDLNA